MKGQRKIKFPHLVGSKWTSVSPVLGWRHFEVTAREDRKTVVFAHMQSVCGPDAHLWINAVSLKDRDLWVPGWTLMAELVEEAPETISETGQSDFPQSQKTETALSPHPLSYRS
jgi:tryptophan-rich hypothetical protein